MNNDKSITEQKDREAVYRLARARAEKRRTHGAMLGDGFFGPDDQYPKATGRNAGIVRLNLVHAGGIDEREGYPRRGRMIIGKRGRKD